MTNLEKIKKIFENTGSDVEFYEEKNNTLGVELHFSGNSQEFTFYAEYQEDFDIDYLIPTLKTCFNYNESVDSEEGWFVSNMMNQYIEYPENNGCYACENIMNSWELEKKSIQTVWDNFSYSLEENINILSKSYEIEARYNIDWDNISIPECGWEMFLMMCAGDMCACEETLVDTLIKTLDDDEKIDKYTIAETEDGNIYLIKTTDDRVFSLNELC